MVLRQRTTLLDGLLLSVVFPNSYNSKRYRWLLRLAHVWTSQAPTADKQRQEASGVAAWLLSALRNLVRLLSSPIGAHSQP